jgi:hypothetical protein
MRGDIANAYTDGHCHANCDPQRHSYSDSDCDSNTNSDTYRNSQRVAYGYAKGNTASARYAASEAVTVRSVKRIKTVTTLQRK